MQRDVRRVGVARPVEALGAGAARSPRPARAACRRAGGTAAARAPPCRPCAAPRAPGPPPRLRFCAVTNRMRSRCHGASRSALTDGSAADQQRDGHVREHDDVAQRQQRQPVGELERLVAARRRQAARLAPLAFDPSPAAAVVGSRSGPRRGRAGRGRRLPADRACRNLRVAHCDRRDQSARLPSCASRARRGTSGAAAPALMHVSVEIGAADDVRAATGCRTSRRASPPRARRAGRGRRSRA